MGGILVLLVFGILLTGRATGQLGLETPVAHVGPAVVAGALLFLGLSLALCETRLPGRRQPTSRPRSRRPRRSAARSSTPTSTCFPFELVSVLLLVALVGAAYLVRRRRRA